MKNNIVLDKSFDLYLTMAWPHDNDHGICGHVFEIIDYYLFLRDRLKVGIFIGENMDWFTLEKAIRKKYEVSNEIINEIKNNTTFKLRPKIVKGKNILIVDGGIKGCLCWGGVKLIFKNILNFRCDYLDTHHDLQYKNLKVLQDLRVYDDGDNDIAINYIKKINFKYYKKIKKVKTNTALIYATKNERSLTKNQIDNIINNYNFEKYLIVTSDPIEYKNIFKDYKNLIFPEMPVDNIFEKFDTFIYTPIGRCFDCSPRFIVECKHYGKDVIYDNIDEDYLNKDTGLKYRKYDIENNLSSLYLQEDDNIIDIINETIN